VLKLIPMNRPSYTKSWSIDNYRLVRNHAARKFPHKKFLAVFK